MLMSFVNCLLKKIPDLLLLQETVYMTLRHLKHQTTSTLQRVTLQSHRPIQYLTNLFCQVGNSLKKLLRPSKLTSDIKWGDITQFPGGCLQSLLQQQRPFSSIKNFYSFIDITELLITNNNDIFHSSGIHLPRLLSKAKDPDGKWTRKPLAYRAPKNISSV